MRHADAFRRDARIFPRRTMTSRAPHLDAQGSYPSFDLALRYASLPLVNRVADFRRIISLYSSGARSHAARRDISYADATRN